MKNKNLLVLVFVLVGLWTSDSQKPEWEIDTGNSGEHRHIDSNNDKVVVLEGTRLRWALHTDSIITNNSDDDHAITTPANASFIFIRTRSTTDTVTLPVVCHVPRKHNHVTVGCMGVGTTGRFVCLDAGDTEPHTCDTNPNDSRCKWNSCDSEDSKSSRVVVTLSAVQIHFARPADSSLYHAFTRSPVSLRQLARSELSVIPFVAAADIIGSSGVLVMIAGHTSTEGSQLFRTLVANLAGCGAPQVTALENVLLESRAQYTWFGAMYEFDCSNLLGNATATSSRKSKATNKQQREPSWHVVVEETLTSNRNVFEVSPRDHRQILGPQIINHVIAAAKQKQHSSLNSASSSRRNLERQISTDEEISNVLPRAPRAPHIRIDGRDSSSSTCVSFQGQLVEIVLDSVQHVPADQPVPRDNGNQNLIYHIPFPFADHCLDKFWNAIDNDKCEGLRESSTQCSDAINKINHVTRCSVAEACCACGGGDLVGQCHDMSFVGAGGITCNSFTHHVSRELQTRCENVRGVTVALVGGEQVERNVSATQACCACGGGVMLSEPKESAEYSLMSSYLQELNSCQFPQIVQLGDRAVAVHGCAVFSSRDQSQSLHCTSSNGSFLTCLDSNVRVIHAPPNPPVVTILEVDTRSAGRYGMATATSPTPVLLDAFIHVIPVLAFGYGYDPAVKARVLLPVNAIDHSHARPGWHSGHVIVLLFRNFASGRHSPILSVESDLELIVVTSEKDAFSNSSFSSNHPQQHNGKQQPISHKLQNVRLGQESQHSDTWSGWVIELASEVSKLPQLRFVVHSERVQAHMELTYADVVRRMGVQCGLDQAAQPGGECGGLDSGAARNHIASKVTKFLQKVNGDAKDPLDSGLHSKLRNSNEHNKHARDLEKQRDTNSRLNATRPHSRWHVVHGDQAKFRDLEQRGSEDIVKQWFTDKKCDNDMLLVTPPDWNVMTKDILDVCSTPDVMVVGDMPWKGAQYAHLHYPIPFIDASAISAEPNAEPPVPKLFGALRVKSAVAEKRTPDPDHIRCAQGCCVFVTEVLPWQPPPEIYSLGAHSLPVNDWVKINYFDKTDPTIPLRIGMCVKQEFAPHAFGDYRYRLIETFMIDPRLLKLIKI